MALLKIARMGHPVLIQRAEPVPDPGAPEIRRLAADMIETMLDAPGVGLAAPQVHVPLRLFVLHLPAERAGGEEVGPLVVINPTFEPVGEERALRWEGCLSIPGLRAAVPRWVRIRYDGVDCDGNPVGGTSIDAGTIEYRQRIGKSFGTAVFVDAGQVGATSSPFQGGIKVGAGIGLRYYTPIGPIRVDFAVPVVHQANSGNFQFYIGIGQAF